MLQRIEKAACLVENAIGKAEVAIILGSGLGDYANELKEAKTLKYSDIPGFPQSTVQGHVGQFISGWLMGKRVLMMQGRFHAYEGYSLSDVTLPVRVMARMGIRKLIVTNACGGVNADFKPGDLMIIKDFINFAGMNPLEGKNLDEFGPRFPDMTHALSRKFISLAKDKAISNGLDVKEGVYCWFRGPNYETPAEIRMARIIGADAVGMSTVPEILVARHSGLETLGISCITNMAAGMLDQPLDHNEVVKAGIRVRDDFKRFLNAIIKDI